MVAQGLTFPKAGERHAGEFTSDIPVLQGWSWPYVTITGRQDGPQATVIAGIHGCEYPSIRAAVRLSREIDPAEVIGRLLVVPIVNLPSFWERSPFVTPQDGKNPNRVFPGLATGTFTDALAYLIYNACIAPSQAFIDLHGGDMVEELAPFTSYAAEAAPEVVAKSRPMAEAFGIPYIIARQGEILPVPGLTHLAAAKAGIPSVLAEAGGIGQLTLPDVDLLFDGTRRALQAAGNLPGKPQPPAKGRHITRQQAIRAPQSGFWICDVRAGEEVRQGQRLGQILTLLGDPLETVEAPFDGVVLYRTTSAAVKADGLLMNVSA